MGTAGWGSLGGLVPVFILRPPVDSPVPVSPPSQGSGKGYVRNKGEELVSGTGDSSRTDLCPMGCIPCSDNNPRGWLNLDSSGEGKVSSLLLPSGEAHWWCFLMKCFLNFNPRSTWNVKSFTGPIYFDILLGERSGTVPMYLPHAEGSLLPSFFPWCDRHRPCPAMSNCRAGRPEGAQLHQPPWAAEQPRPAALPEAAPRTQLDTAAAQHGADNQWRKGEMWQKWLERILSSGDLAHRESLSRKSQSNTMCSLSTWEKQARELTLLPSVLWIGKQWDSEPHCFSYLSAPLHTVPGSGCTPVPQQRVSPRPFVLHGWDSLRQQLREALQHWVLL